MDTISILIVEDNPADVLIIQEYLSEKKGGKFRFAETASLLSALDMLLNNSYDVILLDLSLPDSSGLDTVRQIIGASAETPLVVLTGLQDEELALQAVRYGAQDYLEKQELNPTMLYKSIMYSIGRKKALMEKQELLSDLANALKRIESLEGILPICVNCKKILNENQQWLRLEEYVRDRADAAIIKMVCPACRHDLDQQM